MAMDTHWKKYSGHDCEHGRKIFIVDGFHVRNTYDSDFSQGGNGYRYRWIPKDEIWIDACLSPEEADLVVYHECIECEFMKKGDTYYRAHNRAKYREDQLRKTLFPQQATER
jgi:hypothetical protein